MNHTNQDWDSYELFDPFPQHPPLNAEQRARKLQSLYRIADGFGPWEFEVLHSIDYDYGQVQTVNELIQRAFGTSFERNPVRATDAIDRCFDSGWIQFLTAEFLERKQRELDAGSYLITDSGLIGFDYKDSPPIGYISFGEAGAKVWHCWLDSISRGEPPSGYGFRTEDGVPFVYGTTIEECNGILDDPHMQVLHRGQPIEVGRWCERWWNLYESGYKIPFVEEPYEFDP